MDEGLSVGVFGTVAMVSLAWLAGLAPADGAVAASPEYQRPTGVTTRASVGPGGAQANHQSHDSAISGTGRYVTFTSWASNLVPGDTNDTRDVFVRDRRTHVTRRVSVGPGGVQSTIHDPSFESRISADGRYVAFTSQARLAAGDTNSFWDVYVRDRKTHVTRRVSVGPGGLQTNEYSQSPAISAHGRYVAFESDASNLVAGDTNEAVDVFVRDRKAHVTRRVSVGANGAQSSPSRGSGYPVISAGGRYVAFHTSAFNLVIGDTNDSVDVFVRDRVAHVTRRVSIGRGGAQANGNSLVPVISARGRYVAFSSDASNLAAGDTIATYDVFVRDRVAQVTRRLSIGRGGAQPNGNSFVTGISADGRYVVFTSRASNLVARDTNGHVDVFVRDRVTHLTRLVSVGRRGGPANRDSPRAAISADGRHVAFDSQASNLVRRDSNRRLDVFVRDYFK